MIKIGSTLTTQKRLSLLEHLLYRLRLQHGGIFLIKTPEKNGRSFLLRYLEKNLSVYEMVFMASSSSKNVISWIGKSFRLSSPSIDDLKRELKPIHLNGRNIIMLIERISFFQSAFLNDLEKLLNELPFLKIVITGTKKELQTIQKNKELSSKILSRENWPSLSFSSSMEFLEAYYPKLSIRPRFLIAFTSHGRPGILQKLADHISIFKNHISRRTVQVILKNYFLTFPFFPKNFGFLTILFIAGLSGYFAFHPVMKTWKEKRLDRARQVLEQSLQTEPKTKIIIETQEEK